MSTIIVCTNFSETSRNALLYACSFIKNRNATNEIDVLILHAFAIPANYSGDGIEVVTINNGLRYAEEDLHDELEWIRYEHPEVIVTGKISIGRLVEVLKEQIEDMETLLAILGTGGLYAELWSWNNNILQLLRELPVPMLTVPPGVSFTPLQNIAFACNLKNIHLYSPFGVLKNIMQLTQANLHIVYVTDHEIKPNTIEKQNEWHICNLLSDIDPVYHTLYENQVVAAISRFVHQNNIHLLVVMPKKHGVWQSLWHKSHTKELARLNKLPIMALH